jgi:hypothetical protein
MITLRLQQIRVPSGQRILLEAISWHEFAAIIEELGEHRGTRPVVEGMTQFVEMSRTAATAPALRAFRQWVQEHIQP